MKNFKKVMALALAFAMVLSTMTTAFAATANADKAQVLYDLDLFDGKSADEYMPALEDAATAPEALKLIGTALGWTVDADATTTFEDVPAWAVPWVAKAVELEITNGVSDTEFGSDVIDGKRVVTWFLRALGYDMDEAWNDTETLAATAGLTIPTATLRDDVVGVIYQGLMTTPVGAESTLIETIVLDDAAKTAIAEDAGLVDASLAIESVTAVGVKAVEVKLNKAVDTDTTTVKVKKGAAVYGTAATFNDAKNTATVATVIDLTAGDYTIEVATADETLTETLTVVAEGAATIEITTTEVANVDGVEFEFEVKNQYGEVMDVDAGDAVTAVAYNVTKGASVAIDDADADDIFNLADLNDNDNGESYDAETGDVVRVTLSYLGMTTVANLAVIEVADEATFGFGGIVIVNNSKEVDADDLMLDATNDYVKVEYTLLDQYGVAIDLATVDAAMAPSQTAGDVQFISSDTDVIDGIEVDSDGNLLFDVAGAGTAIITAVVNATGSVSTISITVNDASAADAVAITAPTVLVASRDDDLELPITVTDQYGSVLTSVTGLTVAFADEDVVDQDDDVDAADNNSILPLDDTDDVTTLTVAVSDLTAGDVDETASVKIEVSDADGVIGSISFDIEPEAEAQEIKAINVPTVFEIDSELGISGSDFTVVDQYGRAYEGTVALDYPTDQATDDEDTVIVDFNAIGDDDAGINVTNTADDTGVATVEATIDSATFEFEVKVIASGSIDSYTMSDLGTVFADVDGAYAGDYTIDVTVTGVDADGNEVVLADNVPQLVTTSNAAVASIAVNTLTGEAAGTATISSWIDGVKVASASVTISEAAPVAETVEFSATTIVAAAGDVNLNTIVDVTDQYGVEVTTDGAVVTLFFAGGTEVATTGVVTDADDGTDEVETITVITSNGLSATADITID